MYTELQFCLLFYVDVKLGVSHQGKDRLRIFSNKLLKNIFGAGSIPVGIIGIFH